MASVVERIDLLESDLRRIERELSELRLEVAAPVPDAPVIAPPPVVTTAPAPPPPATPVSAPASPRRRLDVGELLERWDLLGARGLAVAGGAVTALGIGLLFVLAAEQGWMGPVARVGAGAAASIAVFSTGLVAHRRYGQLVAGLAAVGAGIAGAYATLAAATALYGLVPDAAALVLAAAIAAAAVTVSLAWGSELVAALGLVGAALAPALQAVDAQITADAVAFAVVVLAATAIVSVSRRWELLLGVLAAVVGAEAVWLVAVESPSRDPWTLAVLAATAGVTLASACAWQVTGLERAVSRLGSTLLLADVGFVLLASLALLGAGPDRGVALAVAAGVLALCWLLLRRVQPDFALVLAAGALALGAVAVAGLLSGDGLTIAWAAEAAALSWLAGRLRDARLQLAGLAYAGLAIGHLLFVTAPLDALFEPGSGASMAIPTLAAALGAAAAGLFAPRSYRAGGEVGVLAFLDEVRRVLLAHRPRIVEALLSASAMVAVVAFGVAAVAIDFEAGHVALSAVAGLAAVAGTVVAARRASPGLAAVALAGSFAIVAESTLFDLVGVWWLGGDWGAASLLVAAVQLLAAGVLLRVCWSTREPLGLASGAAAGVALASALVALGVLAPAEPDLAFRLWFGASVAAVALVYLALSAAVFRFPRLRNLATVLWSLGIFATLVAESVLVDDAVLIAVAVAATAAAAAAVGHRAREPRLWIAAAAILGLDAVAVATSVTPLERLVTAGASPAAGVAAPFAIAVATVVLASTAPRYRRWLFAGAAAVALYSVSLVILDVAMRLSGGAIDTGFERGHTVVSAVWALTGLGVLVVGVTRGSRELRYTGLALFGFTLAKIFLFDLAELSSVARAVSFVAVGGLLLVGGFLVQRLGEREGEILGR